MDQLRPDDAIAIEVSGAAFCLYDALADRAGQVIVVDARVMHRLDSGKRKTHRRTIGSCWPSAWH